MIRFSNPSPGRRATRALPTAAALFAFAAAPAVHAQVTESFIGLNNENALFRFSASTTSGPSTATIATTNLAGNTITTTTSVTGFVTGSEILASIDFRPSNSLLYGLTRDDSGIVRLYTINTTSGAALLVSTLVASTGGTNATATPFANAVYTIDFNPQADALRIVNTSGGNYRISSANLANGSGTTFTDMALSQTGIQGIAYTNNFAGATSTQLFDTQASGSTLYEQTPPNSGLLVAQPGNTGFSRIGETDVSGITGFGYFAGTNGVNSADQNAFYRFNNISASAATTQVGTFNRFSLGAVFGFAAPVGPAATAAPEPGSLSLLGMGLISGLGTLGIARKRRKKAIV